jgi:hypothetical protein
MALPSADGTNGKSEGLRHRPKHQFDPAFTDKVIGATGPNAHPRLAQIMPALVRHLHDFAREVNLTVAEWSAGVELVCLSTASHVRPLLCVAWLLTVPPCRSTIVPPSQRIVAMRLSCCATSSASKVWSMRLAPKFWRRRRRPPHLRRRPSSALSTAPTRR